MIHGRFQPFHNGHLAYLLGAGARCEALYVGITNPDPTHVAVEEADPDRSSPQANPFPYHLRQAMVCEAAAEAGVECHRLAVVPFPIHQPELWSCYVPPHAVQYLRLFSPWGETKRARLEAAGYRVEVLEGRKEVSGTEVRRRLREGGAWEELVPPAVARLVVTTC
jgi:nicotinamide-nucleotide adenylyltransferase